MLSMKTLKVAIVTMGSALLLGPGFAAATVQQLDAQRWSMTRCGLRSGNADGDERPCPWPMRCGATTLDGRSRQRHGARRTTHYALVSPDHDTACDLWSRPSERSEERNPVYVRLDLEGGMVLQRGSVSLNQAAIGADDDGEITTDLGNALPQTLRHNLGSNRRRLQAIPM